MFDPNAFDRPALRTAGEALGAELHRLQAEALILRAALQRIAQSAHDLPESPSPVAARVALGALCRIATDALNQTS